MAPWVVATSVEPSGADPASLNNGGCVDASAVVVVVVLPVVGRGAAVRRLEWHDGRSMQMANAKSTSCRCRRLMQPVTA
jgi:hypothetical protein